MIKANLFYFHLLFVFKETITALQFKSPEHDVHKTMVGSKLKEETGLNMEDILKSSHFSDFEYLSVFKHQSSARCHRFFSWQAGDHI